MDLSRYFDHAATTPMLPEVIDAMLPYLHDLPGNAHSIHTFGMEAREAVERAREQVASALGAESQHQIFFTSGATEANNWVLRSVADMRVSRLEHSSLKATAMALGRGFLENDGYQVQVSGPSAVMAVNNETGGILECSGVGELHVDATQAIGKIAWQVGNCTWAVLSGHKFGGPKGIGVLYVRDGYIEPLIYGGGQEQGLRGGTLNVPGIVGVGAAIERATQDREMRAEQACLLRGIVLEGLGTCRDFTVHQGKHNSPFILSLGFAGVLGESLVIEMDRLGFAISSGAACSASSQELSPVLAALGIEETYNRGTVRISFGETNTPESAKELGENLSRVVEKVRGMGHKTF